MPTFGQHDTTQRLFTSGVGGLYLLKENPQRIIKVLLPAAGVWSDEQLREEIDAFLLRARTQQLLAKSSRCWAPVHEVGILLTPVETSHEAPAIAPQVVAAATPPAAGPPPAPAQVDQPSEQKAAPRPVSVSLGPTSAELPPGAYLITDRYERTVQSLIDGRVAITNDDLRTIISSVLRGLIDIHKTGRAHGALRPSNILLTHSALLPQATIHLADPAPDGALSKSSIRRDLSDLARIIYELVNLRPYQGGTIGRSREWNRLGPNGEDWRKLCGVLLDTGAPPDALDLEKIHATVQTWLAQPPRDKRPFLIAASILLVLGLGGFSLWYFTRPPKLAFDQANWERLCLQYYGWFGDFSDRLADPAARQKFAGPNYPADIVKLLTDGAEFLDKSDPRKIARKPSSFTDLAINPTDDAKTGYGPYYTKKGVELIDSVAAALGPSHWPLLQSLEKSAKTFDDRGWKRPAAGIRSLIAQAQPPAAPAMPLDIAGRTKAVHPVDEAANVEGTLGAFRAVTDINQRWDRIQEGLKRLPPTDIPLVKAFSKFAEDFSHSDAPLAETQPSAAPGAPSSGNPSDAAAAPLRPSPANPYGLGDVTALAASLSQIEETLNQVAAALSPQGRDVAYSELAKDPAAALPPNAPPTLEQFKSLVKVAPDYVKLASDPRAAVDWSRSLDEIQKEFIDKITEANPEDANLPALARRQAELKAQVAAFAPANIPPIEKNRTRIIALVNQAKDDLSKLNRDGAEWVAPYIIDPAAFIAQQKARITSSPLARATPVVYAEWQKHHNALLAKISATPEELKKYRVYKAVDAKFNTLEAIYKDFDAARIPPAVPGLSQVTGNDWRHAIASYVATSYREKALSDLMTSSALKWQEDLPLVDEPGYLSFQRQRLADFDKARTDTLALLADFAALSDRLNHLQLLAADPPALRATPTWRELFARWQRHALLADPVIARALAPQTDRIKALLALDNVSDYKPLLDAVASPAPEIALTAWRKLGAASITEATPVLDDEDAAETALSSTLSKQQGLQPAQLAALTGEIAAQRPIRWRRYAEILTTPATIQSALDRADSFKVALSPQADPAMSFNRLLYGLRKEFDKNPKESDLKATAQTFINAVNALPPAISANKAIQDLLVRMSKPLQATEVESSTAGAGPRLAGWEQENPSPDLRIFYFPNKAAAKYTLAFSRLQVTESSAAGVQKSVFLCTVEMPVGLFSDTVNASNKFADLDNAGKPSPQQHWFRIPANSSDDVWADIRGWRISDRKFALNQKWMIAPSQMGTTPLYPPNAEPHEPAETDPMHYVSPWSAMYVARLLGCRLPTSDEWRAAYDKYETGNGLPRDVWNLRGDGPPNRPTWKSQQDYALKYSANSLRFPDHGIFLTEDLLFADISAKSAKPWKADDLARLAPARITPSSDLYKGNTLWFRPVGNQPNTAAPATGVMHDLVGNVAEYVFDGPSAIAVLKDNVPTVAGIDAAMTAGRKNLFVIGGSSLSPPEIPFNQKQNIDITGAQAATGYADVGFRLAYTAPIDSIFDVLAAAFKEPPYLPGPRAKLPG